MDLNLIGINFKSAPIDVRERATYTAQQIPDILRRLGTCTNGAELALLSTCNRTELYLGGTRGVQDCDCVIGQLVSESTASELDMLRPLFYEKRGPEAAEHLVAVTSSLDSMVVGETEILGQVKQAYALASDAKTLGSTLNRVFQSALRIAKRVHTETDICRGRVSVSSIAVELAEKVFEKISAKTAMIIGAGETAELAMEHLVKRGVHEVIVVNRTLDKAKRLAETYGGKAIQLELLTDYLTRADIVISSAAAAGCILAHGAIKSAIHDRRGRPMLLVDIAVPRNINPDVGNLAGVYLYHIDDLKRVADANLARRKEAVDHAWKIVRLGAVELIGAIEMGDIRRIFAGLDSVAEDHREIALRQVLSSDTLASLPPSVRSELTEILERAISGVLDSPRKALESAARNGHWGDYAKVTSDLFALDRRSPHDES
jgi:glutamyl-tRNA reductase